MLDRSLIVLETTAGVQRFSDYPDLLREGRDIRLSFPELIGVEYLLIDIIEGRQKSWELKSIARSNSQDNGPQFIDIYVGAYLDKQEKLFMLLEDVSERMKLKQTLTQRENETYLLLEKLAARQDYLDKVIASMADALLVTTTGGKIKTVNQATEILFGYSQAELIGKEISLLSEDLLLPINQDILLEKRISNLEVYCQRKTEEEIAISFSCAQIQIDIAESAFVYIGRDISERKRYEAQITKLNADLAIRVEQRTVALRQSIQQLETEIADRKQAQAAHQAAKEQLQAVLDAVPGFVSWISADGRYKGVNQHLANHLHLNPEAFVGKELGFIQRKSQFVEFMHQFIADPRDGDSQVIETQVNDEKRSYLVAAQKYQQRTAAVSVGIDITERKKALEALRQSERKFRAIFDHTFQFVWLLSPDGKVLEANQTALSFGGIQLAEIVGRPFWNSIWWTISRKIQEQLQKAIARGASGEFVRYEVDVLGADRGVATIDFSIKPVKDETGKVVLLIPEGRDITERKLAEVELQRQNRRSQLLSEVTLKIRQSLELDEIMQTTVSEVQKILGADRVLIFQFQSEYSGMVVKEAVLPGWPVMQGQILPDRDFDADDLDSFRQGKIEAIADFNEEPNKRCNLELLQSFVVRSRLVVPVFIQAQLWGLLIAHQCGSHRQWTDFEIELLQQLANQIGIALSQGQLLEHLEEMVAERTTKLVVANLQLKQEISDRQQAELALRRSEEQLRLITDALPVLISYIDSQQYYRFNNRAYAEWFGRPGSEIQGRKIQEIIGDEHYERIREYIETALSGQRVDYETKLLHSDGSTRYISVTYIPLMPEDEVVTGFCAVVSDISDRKAVEQMKDEFVSVVSHELRTPLTSIRGSLGLLATGKLGTFSERAQRMLEIAVNNTDRLSRLINDILDLERMESGRVKMVKQTCDAGQLILQATEAIQSWCDKESITLSVHPLSISVLADPDHIVQTLTNLIGNAIKFSPSGGTIWITVEKSLDNSILFKVKDRGRGIPADKLETIFERFQQVDASDAREKGGTGLGLAICRQILQQHGGRIWAESVLGEGSTFCFTLPA